jgi:ketosteroid isomerase-like protein
MRAHLLCFGLVVVCLAPTWADSADDEKEILRLEDTITKAWLKHDTVMVSSIVADDFQSWSFKGARRGKADLLRTVEKNTESNTKVDDAVVRVYGDAAVYTARVTDSGTRPNGESFITKTCVTEIYIRRSGRWQLVASHESLLPDGI